MVELHVQRQDEKNIKNLLRDRGLTRGVEVWYNIVLSKGDFK